MNIGAESQPHEACSGDVTLASYEVCVEAYLQQTPPPAASVRAYLDEVADLVGSGTILELGSGPGRDAAYLETGGPRVVRTDAANAFVELLRADGYPARLLDIRKDEFGPLRRCPGQRRAAAPIARAVCRRVGPRSPRGGRSRLARLHSQRGRR